MNEVTLKEWGFGFQCEKCSSYKTVLLKYTKLPKEHGLIGYKQAFVFGGRMHGVPKFTEIVWRWISKDKDNSSQNIFRLDISSIPKQYKDRIIILDNTDARLAEVEKCRCQKDQPEPGVMSDKEVIHSNYQEIGNLKMRVESLEKRIEFECQEHQKDFIGVDDDQTTEKIPKEGADIWEIYADNLRKDLLSVTEKNERLERKIKLEQTYSDSLERDIKNLEERLEGMDGENLKK